MNRFFKLGALWLCLVLPSAFSVEKYFGPVMVVVYGVVVAFAVVSLPYLQLRTSERGALWLASATFALLATLFAIGYPIVNSQIPGFGSDDDDALNVAVSEVLHGHFPYYARTYLGNVIHHFPGAIFIAVPFVLLGTSALQNLFWLALFFLVLRQELGDSFGALRWFWLMLLFSPIVAHQLVTGTGHVANAIYVMLGLWWLVKAEHKTVPAIAWGVALSSRANFLFLIPIAFGWFAQRYGWKTAVRLLVLTCVTCALVTLPYYFYDPHGFAPLDAADRLTRFDEVFPYAGWVIGMGMALLSVTLSVLRIKTESSLWLRCALVQAFPVITGYLLGRDLVFLAYGGFFLCFGILAAATQEKADSTAIDQLVLASSESPQR